MSDESALQLRPPVERSRRRLLAAVAGGGALAATSALSGCLDAGSGGVTTDANGTTSAGGDADTRTDGDGTDGDGTDGGGTEGETSTLDLREANVTAVEVSETDSGTRFSVTLHHDDDGEDGYANWWAVETLDGEALGRRELAHPHCTCEFTRSETVQIPDGVECVVIRGHDQTHGYGGRAAIVTPSAGDVAFVDQGEEPTSVADADCPAQAE